MDKQTDRLEAIKAQWGDSWDSRRNCREDFDVARRDIRWLLVEAERLRTMLDMTEGALEHRRKIESWREVSD